MQKNANLVELEKCCQTHIFLQNFVSIQPRTSPPKLFAKFANFADPNQLYFNPGLACLHAMRGGDLAVAWPAGSAPLLAGTLAVLAVEGAQAARALGQN